MNINKLILLLTIGTFVSYAQHPPTGGGHATHGHAGHNEHLHKTLHPHMHLHKKNYVNAIKLEMGLSSATYYGELCDNKECFQFRPGLNFGASYRYNKRWLFRSQLNYATFGGQDKGRNNASRNLSFLTHGVELNVGAVYDIIKFEPLYFRRLDVLPYLHAGIGFLQYSPTTKYNGEWYRLRPIETEGAKYSQFAAVIPFGLGLRFKMHDHWDLCTEFGFRYTTTDYLDDVSKNYAIKPPVDEATYNAMVANPTRENLQFLLSDRSGEIGKNGVVDGNYNQHNWYYYQYSQGADGLMKYDPAKDGKRKRGNSAKRDNYFLFTARLEYTIKVLKQRDVSFNRAFNPRFRARKR